VRELDPARARNITVDPLALDQLVDEIRRSGDQLREALAVILPEHGGELGGVVLEHRDDLPAIPSGGAPARLERVDDGAGNPALGKMQRCRQASEARAYDRYVHWAPN
jgi:hypothetical protein